MRDYLNLTHLILWLNVQFIVNQFGVGDWLVKRKPATTIGWASRDFEIRKRTSIELKLDVTKSEYVRP